MGVTVIDNIIEEVKKGTITKDEAFIKVMKLSYREVERGSNYIIVFSYNMNIGKIIYYGSIDEEELKNHFINILFAEDIGSEENFNKILESKNYAE